MFRDLERMHTLFAGIVAHCLDRVIPILSAAFAMLATLLAAVRLYGVLAYTVSQRTKEIGLRMALGADAGRVRALVMRQVGGMIVVGGVAALRSPGTRPGGASRLGVAALAFVALVAGAIPARRASRIDPMRALRYE